MAKNTPSADGIRVLVCGSTRFEDQSFVFSMLNGFANHFDISAILSGPFSGSDAYVREWAKERGLPFEPVNIAPSERMELAYFDEGREIPKMALRNDSMFRKGFEKLRESAPTVMLAIPNPEGELGATCSCLKRMAGMLGIECIDGSKALRHVAERMEAAVAEPSVEAESVQPAAGRSAKVRA